MTGLSIAGSGATANGLLNIVLASTGTHAFLADPGQTITVSATAVLSGTGGALLKTGAGTLVLVGSNGYTGGTAISAGMLRANGTSPTGSGAVTIGSGGTLGGNGSAGAVAVTSGGTITAGLDLTDACRSVGDAKLYLRYAIDSADGRPLSEDTFWFAEPKAIDLPRAAVSVDVAQTNPNSFRVRLASPAFQ